MKPLNGYKIFNNLPYSGKELFLNSEVIAKHIKPALFFGRQN
jgi:hypothetical protein